jgi:hypothetical protein
MIPRTDDGNGEIERAGVRGMVVEGISIAQCTPGGKYFIDKL